MRIRELKKRQSAGGVLSSSRLTPEQRSERAKRASESRWHQARVCWSDKAGTARHGDWQPRPAAEKAVRQRNELYGEGTHWLETKEAESE